MMWTRKLILYSWLWMGMTTTTTLFASSSHVAVTVPSASSYAVRSLAGEDENSQNRREIQSITYSDDGIPYIIPLLSIRLFSTPGVLSIDSLRAVQMAMEGYLKDQLAVQFAGSDDNNSTNATAAPVDPNDVFTDINVLILDDRSVTERRRLRRGRHLLSSSQEQAEQQQQQRHRVLQRQGTEIDMQVTLNFAEQPIPSENEIAEGVTNSLSNMDEFVNDYLLKTEELKDVDSAQYDATSFTATPSVAPSAAPTPSPNDDTTSTISQANRGQPINDPNGASLRALYPAVIVGVVAMLLTMMILAKRRKRVRDLDDELDSIEQVKAAPVEIDTEAASSVGGAWNHRSTTPMHMMPTDHYVSTEERGEEDSYDYQDDYGEYDDDSRDPYYHHGTNNRNSSSSRYASQDMHFPEPDFILRTASSMSRSYDGRDNTSSFNVYGNLLPSIHHGDGMGYESEDSMEEMSRSNGDVYPPVRGTVKRVDMSGTVGMDV